MERAQHTSRVLNVTLSHNFQHLAQRSLIDGMPAPIW